MKGIFSDLASLETERLLLRRVQKEDVPDIFEYASDKEISKFTPWDYHKNIDVTQRLVNILIENYQYDRESDWAIELKESKKVIGLCGFVRWNKNHNRIEVAYSLSRAFWGKGLTTEAIKELIIFGFERMNLNRIEAKVLPENIASIRVLEKVGMKNEGDLRDYWLDNDTYRDVCNYSIIKKDWSN